MLKLEGTVNPNYHLINVHVLCVKQMLQRMKFILLSIVLIINILRDKYCIIENCNKSRVLQYKHIMEDKDPIVLKNLIQYRGEYTI